MKALDPIQDRAVGEAVVFLVGNRFVVFLPFIGLAEIEHPSVRVGQHEVFDRVPLFLAAAEGLLPLRIRGAANRTFGPADKQDRPGRLLLGRLLAGRVLVGRIPGGVLGTPDRKPNRGKSGPAEKSSHRLKPSISGITWKFSRDGQENVGWLSRRPQSSNITSVHRRL